MLQAMKEEPSFSAKCKDKFLILSTAITLDKEGIPLQDIVGVATYFAHVAAV
jgi:vesicle-associated membrane protein-associated protein A